MSQRRDLGHPDFGGVGIVSARRPGRGRGRCAERRRWGSSGAPRGRLEVDQIGIMAALGLAVIIFIDLAGDSGLIFFLPFLMFIFLLVTSKFKIAPSLLFAVVAMVIYVPAGYYLELFLWRRRVGRKGAS